MSVQDIEKNDALRILDRYDVTTGPADPETPLRREGGGRVSYKTQKSFGIDCWSSRVVNMIMEGVDSHAKGWLHLDKDTSVLRRHTEDKEGPSYAEGLDLPYSEVRELALFY